MLRLRWIQNQICKINNYVQTFKQFFFEKHAIPPTVRIEIKNIGAFDAKADTGNDGYNVLHATDIKDDGSIITFVCNDKQHRAQSQGTMMINKGPKLQENRHVIKLDVTVNGDVYRGQPFTISDRSGMSEPVLLSKDFIAQMNSVVDPSLT